MVYASYYASYSKVPCVRHEVNIRCTYCMISLLLESSIVVATTHQTSTYSMLTSAKLSVGYLVVGITRELDKEPSLYCSSIYINIMWSVLQ